METFNNFCFVYFPIRFRVSQMLLLIITFALSVVIVPLAADSHLELSEFDVTQGKYKWFRHGNFF